MPPLAPVVVANLKKRPLSELAYLALVSGFYPLVGLARLLTRKSEGHDGRCVERAAFPDPSASSRP